MPGSVGSIWSRHTSPEPALKFDPFLIIDDAHAEHYQSSNIIELSESNKLFCPTCLELRSSEDVGAMDLGAYNKFVGGLFDILDRYSETTNLRKIVLTILEIFLPQRTLTLYGDDQFHRVLRILYKLMKSDLYNQNEFVSLAKIMSGISVKSLQPIPLKSVWEAWSCMLDYGQRVSFTDLLDRNSQNIPENLTKFHVGQATIVKSYLALINHIAKDWVSELMFFPHRQKESIYSKYYETSQIRCLKFTQDLLVPNCECYLLRETAQSPLELQVTSEVFGALRECFISASRRKDGQFLDWLRNRDVIAIINRIFSKNPSIDYRVNICLFIKTYIQYYMEAEYGELNELKRFFNKVGCIETVANKIERLDGQREHYDVFVCYLLLNWISIKIKSRYFVASRVRRVLTRKSEHLRAIRQQIKSSRLFMRVFAFVTASSLPSSTENNEVISFLEDDWGEMLRDKTLSVFRYIHCHEPVVFEWAHANEHFLKLVNCDCIDYLVERGVKRNHLVSTLNIILEYPPLRAVFCRYIKRYAKTFFEKLIPMGTNGIDRTIMNDFSGWLPALLHETLLRYMNNSDPGRNFGTRLIGLLLSINMLLNDAQKLRFNPYFDEQFIIDFTKFVELIFSKLTRNDPDNQLLLAASEFMALLIQSNNPCVLKLIQYIDFTLIGYMYSALDNYKSGDCLGDAIAHVLVAYDNLDYPLEHRIERSLYPMSTSAYEWMMSRNPDLHAISIILIEKIYSENESSYCNYKNLSVSARACLVTGFLHMLCSNLEILDIQSTRAKILCILGFDDFKYHPLYSHLVEMVPNLRKADDHEDEFASLPSTPEVSFQSADTGNFEEDHISVSRILEQLNEDEGYKSATVISLPKNIYLNRAIEEQTPEDCYSGTVDWERRAYESTQSSYVQNG